MTSEASRWPRSLCASLFSCFLTCTCDIWTDKISQWIWSGRKPARKSARVYYRDNQTKSSYKQHFSIEEQAVRSNRLSFRVKFLIMPYKGHHRQVRLKWCLGLSINEIYQIHNQANWTRVISKAQNIPSVLAKLNYNDNKASRASKKNVFRMNMQTIWLWWLM